MNLLSVERDLRRAGARLPARLGRAARPAELAADRGVDPDLPVRDAVRALDGLRGLPALAHARGVGRAATTTSAAVAYGLEHTGRIITAGGDHHDRRLRRLHRPAASSACRSSGSACRRRSSSTRPSSARPRPRDDEAPGRLELVPARGRATRAAGAGRPGARDRLAARPPARRRRGAGAGRPAMAPAPARRRRPSRAARARSASARCCRGAGSGDAAGAR